MARQIYEGWLENLNMRNPLLIHIISQLADDAALVWCEQARSVELAAAQSTCKTDRSVRAALLQTQAEMAVASAWATLCRAQGNLTHAIKMQELVVKLGRIDAAQRELLATDDLAELKARARKEDALTQSAH